MYRWILKTLNNRKATQPSPSNFLEEKEQNVNVKLPPEPPEPPEEPKPKKQYTNSLTVYTKGGGSFGYSCPWVDDGSREITEPWKEFIYWYHNNRTHTFSFISDEGKACRGIDRRLIESYIVQIRTNNG